MTIRRLVPADAPAYRALMLEAYEHHPDAFTSSVSERSALPLDWWESRLAVEPAASNVVIGALRDARLAAVAGLSFEVREKVRHKATLFGMVVRPEFRRSGLGRQLVLAALEHAKARGGVRLVQLTVTQGNAAAQALYERCGFVQFGIEPLAVAVGAQFASKVHMWCDLSADAA